LEREAAQQVAGQLVQLGALEQQVQQEPQEPQEPQLQQWLLMAGST
jgi:hypothetical protein